MPDLSNMQTRKLFNRLGMQGIFKSETEGVHSTDKVN